MTVKIFLALAIASVSSSAIAQNTCTELAKAIEHQLKKSASNYADGITDNSAPRATLRELRTSNSLALARINIELMAQNKCPPRKDPVDPMIYLSEALDCEIATQKGESNSDKCKLDGWRGSGSQPGSTEG